MSFGDGVCQTKVAIPPLVAYLYLTQVVKREREEGEISLDKPRSICRQAGARMTAGSITGFTAGVAEPLLNGSRNRCDYVNGAISGLAGSVPGAQTGNELVDVAEAATQTRAAAIVLDESGSCSAK